MGTRIPWDEVGPLKFPEKAKPAAERLIEIPVEPERQDYKADIIFIGKKSLFGLVVSIIYNKNDYFLFAEKKHRHLPMYRRAR